MSCLSCLVPVSLCCAVKRDLEEPENLLTALERPVLDVNFRVWPLQNLKDGHKLRRAVRFHRLKPFADIYLNYELVCSWLPGSLPVKDCLHTGYGTVLLCVRTPLPGCQVGLREVVSWPKTSLSRL